MNKNHFPIFIFSATRPLHAALDQPGFLGSVNMIALTFMPSLGTLSFDGFGCWRHVEHLFNIEIVRTILIEVQPHGLSMPILALMTTRNASVMRGGISLADPNSESRYLEPLHYCNTTSNSSSAPRPDFRSINTHYT
jgi:hypothetical protein